MTQSTVSLIMRGRQTVTSLVVLERIAEGLDMPAEARGRLGLAAEKEPVKRRMALVGIGLAGALSPAMLTDTLRDAAAEAFESTRERTTTAVGSGTIEQLTTVIAELDRAFPWQPAIELFPLARGYASASNR